MLERLPVDIDPGQACSLSPESSVRLSRRALPATLTEDNTVAAAAMIGDSSAPKKG